MHASALEILETLQTGEGDELRRTLADIRIVANLGFYYADKIRGATQLAIFRESNEEDAQGRAIGHLVDAARHWADYATMALKHHKNPLWTNRVGYVDWKKNYQYALEDIRIAGGDPTELGLPRVARRRSGAGCSPECRGRRQIVAFRSEVVKNPLECGSLVPLWISLDFRGFRDLPTTAIAADIPSPKRK